MSDSIEKENQAKEKSPERPTKGSSIEVNGENSVAAGKVAVGGNVDHSMIIAFENVNITVTSESTWELEGGDSLLSEERTISGVVEELSEVLFGKTAYSGPVLLKHLLNNYLTYQKGWRKEPSPSVAIPNLRCFDQEDVKARIRAVDSPARVIELSGPSGIGKTHLLDSICKGYDLEPEKRELWRHSYVSPQGDFEEILGDLIEQLGSQHQPCAPSINGLAECLVDIYVEQNIRYVLFMLDSVDDLESDLLLQLVGDEGPVGEKVRKTLLLFPDLKLRLVITSRRPRLPRSLLTQHDILGVYPISMDTLKVSDVQLMLREQVNQHIKATVEETVIRDMARQIFEITGGHPGTTSLILQKLIKAHFIVPPRGFTDRFRPIVLHSVQRDVIGDLNLQEYLFLNVLSLFRFFNVGFIRQLMQRGLLPNNLLEGQDPTPGNIRCWLDNLCETPALIRRNVQDTPSLFTVHPVLQHVLPMDLEVNSPRILYGLHKEIYQIYNQALQEYDPSGVRLQMSLGPRSVYTMQALYHAAQSELVALQNELEVEHLKLIELAKQYWSLYAGSYNDESGEYQLDQLDPFTLKDQWEKDTDLHELLKCLSNYDLYKPIDTKIKEVFTKSP